MYVRSLAIALVVIALGSAAHADSIMYIKGEWSWSGVVPPGEEGKFYPGLCSLIFPDEGPYDEAKMNIQSEAYNGSFVVTDDGMTTIDTRFFSDEFGEAQAALMMDPLVDPLTLDGLEFVKMMACEWAVPDKNEAAPVSFLSMAGTPVLIPEPSALALLLLGGVLGCLHVGLGNRR